MKTKTLTLLMGLMLISVITFAQSSITGNGMVILSSFDISAISGTDTTFTYQIPAYDVTVSSYWTELTGSGTLEVEFNNYSTAVDSTWFEYDDANPVSITLTGTSQNSTVMIDPGFKYIRFRITKGTISAGTLKVIVYLF